MIDPLSLSLFGRHVLRRAGDLPGPSHANIVDRSREPEVGQLDSFDAVLEQNVCRLDVSMNQALTMSRGQPGRGLHADPQNRLNIQSADLVDLLLQRLPLDKLHDDHRRMRLVIDRVNRHDVIMRDRRRRTSFPQKPLHRDRI